jgi:hypothetical protein
MPRLGWCPTKLRRNGPRGMADVPIGDAEPRQNCRSRASAFCSRGSAGDGCAVRALRAAVGCVPDPALWEPPSREPRRHVSGEGTYGASVASLGPGAVAGDPWAIGRGGVGGSCPPNWRPRSVGRSARHTKLRVDSTGACPAVDGCRACRAVDGCWTCGAARARGGRAGSGTGTPVVAGAHVRRDDRCCRPRAAGRRARPEGTTAYERARVTSLAAEVRARLTQLDRAVTEIDDEGGRRLPTLRATDRLASPTGPARDHTLRALRRVALTAQHNGRPGANVRQPPINPRRFTGADWPPVSSCPTSC